MLSDGELETLQNLFIVEKEIVLFELRKMIEKTHFIEKILNEGVRRENALGNALGNALENAVENVLGNALENTGDSYRPCPETIYPPKKRMKL